MQPIAVEQMLRQLWRTMAALKDWQGDFWNSSTSLVKQILLIWKRSSTAMDNEVLLRLSPDDDCGRNHLAIERIFCIAIKICSHALFSYYNVF